MRAVDNQGAVAPRTAAMLPAGPVESVLAGAAGYPGRLARLPRPPARLWYAGSLGGANGPMIAIVGSRSASAAGCDRAARLAGELGRNGFAIVSGGAFGIDAAAHEGALAADAATFAVLGCGVDVVYPDRHARLFGRITASGALLSEYEPGTQPRPGQFPARNRIIAALADAVVVVEAASRSGALITARVARKLGVPVLAVPGTRGTDGWLAAGGGVAVETAADVADALAGKPPRLVVSSREVPAALSPLLAALAERADFAPGIAARLGLPLASVMSQLTEAELEGRVRRIPGGQYEVTRAH